MVVNRLSRGGKSAKIKTEIYRRRGGVGDISAAMSCRRRAGRGVGGGGGTTRPGD